MEAELTRMEDMTSAFLSYASMERQGINLRLEKVELNRFVGNLCQSLSKFGGMQHDVSYLNSELLETRSVRINIDQHWFHRALQNLISNAVQYANFDV